MDMKASFWAVVALTAMGAGLHAGALENDAALPPVPSEIIVKFKSPVAAAADAGGRLSPGALPVASAHRRRFREARKLFRARPGRALPPAADALDRTYKLVLETPDALPDVLTALKADPNVEYAEPNRRRRVDAAPNDPLFPQQYGLARIAAPQAWDAERGGAGVVIAVLDTGVDHLHPDLAPNMWVNAGEVPGNGVDDDGNGFVDDRLGWDFPGADGLPTDVYVHGTHVAGIAAAATDNAAGMAGVSWRARIMSVKVCSDEGFCSDEDAAAGIIYAVDNGAKVLNNSYGGDSYGHLLADAVAYAAAHGALVVASAGNTPSEGLHYPAAYPDAVAVAATDAGDRKTSFSTYGHWVDVSAPGDQILSTLPNNDYGAKSGTSMSSPHVAGAAAVLMSRFPAAPAAEIRLRLEQGADNIDSLNPAFAGKLGGRINLAKAMTVTQSPPVLYTVRGRVTDPAGRGLEGLQIVSHGGGYSTRADGSYELAGLKPISYTVRPLMAGYDFGPRERVLPPLAADLNGQDFTGEKLWDIAAVGPAGVTGNFAAAAFDAAGRPHVSHIHWATGNLDYTHWTGAAWVTRTVAAQSQGLLDSAIALDPAGAPVVAYHYHRFVYPVLEDALKLARWTGSAWAVETVTTASMTGPFRRVAVDGAGAVHLADVYGGNLRYWKKTGGAWTSQNVAVSFNPVGIDLKLDAQGRPHIVFAERGSAGVQHYQWTGTAWAGGTAVSGADIGFQLNLALGPGGVPHLSYATAANDKLYHAKQTAAGWTVQLVNANGNTGVMNADLSNGLAVDAAGNAHIAFGNPVLGAVQYVKQSGGGWAEQPVDTSFGRWIHLGLNAQGNPRVVYQSLANHTLTDAAYIDPVARDAVPPQVALTAPSDGAEVFGAAVPLSAMATDNTGVVGVTFLLDGQPLAPEDKTAPYGVSWDSLIVANGTHTLTAVARDGAGLTAQAGTTVRVVNTRHFIAGRVTDQSGQAVEGAALRWAGGEVRADASGAYRIENILRGNVDVTALKPGHAFSPARRSYAPLNADQTGQDFTAEKTWDIASVGPTGTGVYLDMAWDAAGRPHVSYLNWNTQTLEHAVRTASGWVVQPVAANAGAVNKTSLALDAQGFPVICFYAESFQMSPPSFTRDVRIARWTGSAWSVETVAGGASFASFPSVAIDALGNVHVAYGLGAVMVHAKKTGGAWAFQNAAAGLPGTGDNDLAVDAQGFPHIAYEAVFSDRTAVKYARLSAAGWSDETVTPPASGGRHVSLAVAADGAPHVAYAGPRNDVLFHAVKSGGLWTTETVEANGNTADGNSELYNDIALGPDGAPHLSFYDPAQDVLKHATKAGGAWNIAVVDCLEDTGWYNKIAVDAGGRPRIAYQSRTGYNLKFADRLPPAPPPPPLVLGDVTADPVTSDGADISWTTSVPAAGRVEYGTSTAYGAAAATAFGAAHRARLTGLRPGTLYHYRVLATDAGGNVAVSGDRTFTTPPAVVKPGDLNGDGRVTLVDLSLLLSRWGTADPTADVVNDGVVDVFDLSRLLFQWDDVVPSAQSFGAPAARARGGAVFVLSPRARRGASDPLVVDLFLDASRPVNAVQAALSYAPRGLTLRSVETADSDFAVGAQESAVLGAVVVARASRRALAGRLRVARLVFDPPAAESATLSFARNSLALSAADAADIAAAAESLTLSARPSSPTFLTPATADGVNDAVIFDDDVAAVAVFDVNGRRVYEGENHGGSAVRWDGRDGGGRLVPSGAYIARLGRVDGTVHYRTLTVVK